MKKHIRVPLLILLALALLFAAGCGEPAAETPDFVYVPEYFSLDGEFEYINNVVSDGADGVYFYTNEITGHRELTEQELAEYATWYEDGVIPEEELEWMTAIRGTAIYHCKVDGTELTRLDNYVEQQPADGKGSLSVERLLAKPDGSLLLLQNYYYYDSGMAEGVATATDMSISAGSEIQEYYLLHLDSTGAELDRMDISAITENTDYVWISGLCCDKDGNIFLSNGNDNSIFIYGADGQLKSKVEQSEDSWINGIYTLSDGTVAVMSYLQNSGGYGLQPLGLDGKFGEAIELPANVYNIYNGGGEYDFYYEIGSDLTGYKIATQESVKLLNWIDSDVDTNRSNGFTLLPDGRVFLSVTDWNRSDGKSETELIVLSKTPYKDIQPKKEITLAANYLYGDLRSQVIEFNKTNPEYRIKVTEYEQYNTEDDWQAGLTKLSTEIASGKVPDMMVISDMPIDQYIGIGLLEDLGPWLDQDGELSREDLLLNVMTSADGSIYQAGSSFQLATLVASSDIVGEEMGWTMADMQAAIAAHPEMKPFTPYITEDTILYYFLMLNAGDYIDWTTGECRFDQPEFVGLLEFANSFPDAESIDYSSMTKSDWAEMDEDTLIMEGKVMFANANLYDVYDYQRYKLLFGGKANYIGYPTSQGVGTRVMLENCLAMTTTCKEKEGAWAFIRTFFTEEYQKEYSWSLPTNRACLEEKFAEYMKSEEEREYSSGMTTWIGGKEVSFDDRLTQEDADRLMTIIESANGTYAYNQQIIDIVTEESLPYFQGQKTAQDVANNIQSRIKLYVNEQL